MENKNNMKLAIVLILIAALMSSVGQLTWKFGANSNQTLNSLLWYLAGFILSGIGLALMTIAFKFGEVSILHPMMSIGFVYSIFLGAWFLNEYITPLKIFGILLITAGSALLGFEGSKD